MEFSKYVTDGAYHWDATSASLLQHVAFTAGRYEAVLRQSVPWPGSRVLDIACGDARLAAGVALAGTHMVLGLDLSRTGMQAGLRRWAREQPRTVDRARMVQGDGLYLPLADEAFDVVIASEVIEHVEDPRRLLCEAVRPLKRNGTLIITTPCRLTDRPLDPHHVREYFPSDLVPLMREFFDNVQVTLSHPAWVTSLYTMRGWAWPFRLLVNLLSILRVNPFLRWPLGRYAAQITIIGRHRRP